MIQNVLESLRSKVAHRVWVFSDLQQAIPAEARRCLTTALEDFRALELPVEQIWYLGDAVEGARLEHLEEMAAMQVEAFAAFGVPLRYVLGNHDFDLTTKERGQSGARAVLSGSVEARELNRSSRRGRPPSEPRPICPRAECSTAYGIVVEMHR